MPWVRRGLRDDRILDYDNFHFMSQRAKSAGWDYHELKTGHDAMITVPDKLIQILGSLVQ